MPFIRCTIAAPLCVLILALSAAAQSMPGMPGMDPSKPPAAKPGGEMPMGMDMGMDMGMLRATTLIDTILQHTSSGTSVEPGSTPMKMVMFERRPGGWQFMLHGNAFVADIQQDAANDRGGDKLFSTNWVMPMAQRKLGGGELTLRTMLSLEPATVTGGSYPELFQQGETWQGHAIVDGQHPHDFVMELGALYDVRLPGKTLLSFYAAPVGDPAIGPTAYPHRHSASENPIAALGHHQEDSTHIAFSVVSAGLTHGMFRIEGSGFHGAEPTDARWHFEPSPNGLAPDSYSGRLTLSPTHNLSAQYSIAHITAPEQLTPNQNQRRQTASVMYNRGDALAVTALWGQTKSLPGNVLENSYLLEALFHGGRNFVWTRMEVAARTSELLKPAPPVESAAGHVQAYSLGYDREYRIGTHLLAAPGGQFTAYVPPAALAGGYGGGPFSVVGFVRFRLGQ